VEQSSNELRVGYADPSVNGLLEEIDTAPRSFGRHFSHSEDFFLLLDDVFTVPHFQIHHDVREQKPSPEYSTGLKAVMEQIVRLAPQVLRELTYFFDPAEILRPCFYRVYRIEETHYLYLLRVDLMARPAEGEVIERGTNDITPLYRTRKLFLEPTVIPLEGVTLSGARVSGFRIRQTVSQTWIGEFGRGYFQQGIWMDSDLTRFFTRLFVPPRLKTYPYFPFLCKYKTVCQSLINLSPEERSDSVPLLHRSLQFLLPVMDRIQEEIKGQSFSEQLDSYRELKQKVPDSWYDAWRNLRIESYLNDAEMKEYRVEG
jgi:hypothetical protein